MKKVIIVSGKAGAGKTTLSSLLKELGFEIIEVDKLAHEVLEDKKEELVVQFGREILDLNGDIDRKKLGEIVFADPEKMKNLENIVHPELKRRIKDLVENSQKHLVLDVAIPNKLELNSLADVKIYVSADEELIRNRLIEKGWDVRKIESLLRLQENEVPSGKYYFLNNNGSIDELKAKVKTILKMEGIIDEN